MNCKSLLGSLWGLYFQFALSYFFLFWAVLVTHGYSQSRDQIPARAVTYTTAIAVLDLLPAVPQWELQPLILKIYSKFIALTYFTIFITEKCSGSFVLFFKCVSNIINLHHPYIPSTKNSACYIEQILGKYLLHETINYGEFENRRKKTTDLFL